MSSAGTGLRPVPAGVPPPAGLSDGNSTKRPVHLRPTPCLAVAPLLIAHAVLVGYAVTLRPPTVDEPAHVAAGLYTLVTGRTDLYPVNPPPVRTLAALPLHLTGSAWDFTDVDVRPGVRSEFDVGGLWKMRNARRLPRDLWVARWTLLPFSVLGGWVCWRWAGDLYGPAGGLTACGLWCFSPLVLENAAVVSMDVPGAAVGLLAGWRLSRFLWKPDAAGVLLAGLSLGGALLCKHTWVIAFGLWPLIWAAWRVLPVRGPTLRVGSRAAGPTTRDAEDRATGTARPPSFPQLAAILALALFVLNAGYGFVGTFTPLGDYRFVSRALTGAAEDRAHHGVGANRFAGTWAGRLPVPVPRDWLVGVDVQRVDFETPGSALVAGRRVSRPPPWAYVRALLHSEPWGTWAVLLLAAGTAAAAAWRRVRAGHLRPPCDLPTLVIAAGLFALVGSQAAGRFYPRYALPAWACLLVWSGRAAVPDAAWRRVCVIVGVAASAIACVLRFGAGS